MKFLLLGLLVIIPTMLRAQNFVHLPFPVEGEQAFEGVVSSSVAFADVDGDNDQDLVFTGQKIVVPNQKFGSDRSYSIAKLYLNDGRGQFSEMRETPFEGVVSSSVAFADVDGDSDQDLVFTGQNRLGNGIASLYLNDGKGRFSETEEMPFEGVVSSSVAFADVDGDSDQDLVITGRKIVKNPTDRAFSIRPEGLLMTGEQDTIDRDRVASLYLNDGKGRFSKAEEVPFKGVDFSSIAFGDVDGDSDQDLLITGMSLSGCISRLYLNDGKGQFSETEEMPFEGVHHGSVAFADVDGDNDQDIFITGRNDSTDRIAKLYLGDGKGGFSEAKQTSFKGVDFSSIAFADVDGDNDQDIFITGINGSKNYYHDRISHLYLNDGRGQFAESQERPFDSVGAGAIAFADVDGDSDQDVFVTGAGPSSNRNRVAHLYINTSKTPAFVEPLQITASYPANLLRARHFELLPSPVEGKQSFDGVTEGSIAFADVDGDNDQDLVITGWNRASKLIANLYLNDGKGKFFKMQKIPFEAVYLSSIAFADVDGDNDQDLLITGQSLSGRISHLYINDGKGQFAKAEETPFEGVDNGSIAFADVDGDSDQDLVITGMNDSGASMAKLYINDGKGRFC